MVLKYKVKGGGEVHGPPYTKEEEDEFYRRNAGGPLVVHHGVDDRKGKKSPAQRQPRNGGPTETQP